MKNKKLEAIAEIARNNLFDQIEDAEDDIEKALASAAREAQLQETKFKFRLNFCITINTDDNKLDTDLSYSVKHSLSVTQELPNPNQPDLPIDETTVRITTTSGVTTGEIPLGKFKEAVKRVKAERDEKKGDE